MKIEAFRITLSFLYALAVDLVGRAGGLAVLWNEPSSVEFLKYGQCFIELLIQDQRRQFEWRALGVYISFVPSIRESQFRLLEQQLLAIIEPLIVLGDFNSTTHSSENVGGVPWTVSQHIDFLEFINNVKLIDLGFASLKRTWSNKRRGAHHMAASGSDHLAFLLDAYRRWPKPRPVFRFDHR
ncbi:hypothetical protein Syun_009896 [Stephania yunnanensis]|uniref:Endonuclease/exonuclease/phosphatase domain-containing protein n=1 Tax=Stephania yunnanensis TaxID=152371 RepID=A0AAP0KFH4_9MAGN